LTKVRITVVPEIRVSVSVRVPKVPETFERIPCPSLDRDFALFDAAHGVVSAARGEVGGDVQRAIEDPIDLTEVSRLLGLQAGGV